MKVESHAVIEISSSSRIVFSVPVSYTSPSKVEVKIVNHDKDDNILVVIMNMETQDLDSATFETERELLRVVNFLSWKYSFVIKKYRTTGYQYSEQVGKVNAIALATTLHLTASISMSKTVGIDDVKEFSNALANNYSDQIDTILLKWRDAISQESPFVRFLLMFQILEFLTEKRTRKEADMLIRDIEPEVQLRMSGRNGDEEVSIYTYLRDCIHAKPENQRFPFNEVEARVSAMQQIVIKALREKFPVLLV